MAKKKKSAPKKITPAKKKTPAKRKPTRKRAKSKPEKKEKKRGVIGRAIGKIPTKYKVKGGKAKYKSKYGESEVEYEEVEVGK